MKTASTLSAPAGSDKVVHFVIYFVLSLVLLMDLMKRKVFPVGISCLVALGIPVIYGGLMEIVQYFLPYRSAAWFDFLANSVGSMVAVLIGYFIFRRR